MTWFMIILVIMCMWLYAHNVFSLTYSCTVPVICLWLVYKLICMRVCSVLMYTYSCHNVCLVIWVHKNEYMLLRSVATLFIYALSFYGDRNLIRHFASWHVVTICIHTVLIISLQCILLSEITNLNIICWNVSSTSMYIYEFYFVIVEFFR